MKILRELSDKGIKVTKTEHFYRGLQTTEKGIVATRNESNSEKGIYFLEIGGRTLPCNDQVIFITSGTEFEGKVKTKEEAEALAEAGKILSFKSSDLYAEYYNFAEDEDLECCFKYGCSARSRKYVEETMKEIGLSGFKEDDEYLDVETVKEYGLYINEPTKIGKLESGWVAQTEHWNLDNYYVTKMYFDRLPTESEIVTAFYIIKFSYDPIEVFRCQGCDRISHWLEIPGDFKAKYTSAEERYCGLC